MSPPANAGGLHHKASGVLSREAFKAGRRSDEVSGADSRKGCGRGSRKKCTTTQVAADLEVVAAAERAGPLPPDQLTGLKMRWWICRASMCCWAGHFRDIGTEERSMHKCQGMAQLLSLPTAGAPQRFLLMDTFAPDRPATKNRRCSTASTRRFPGSRGSRAVPLRNPWSTGSARSPAA